MTEIDREREMNMYRGGSAPPTVEGSLSAMGGLFGGEAFAAGGGAAGYSDGSGFMSEEELLSDPAYASYYYSRGRLNPRLPPPVSSKEDWRFTQQRLHAGEPGVAGIGGRREVNHGAVKEGERSLFSVPPGFGLRNGRNVELNKAPGSREWLEQDGDALIRFSGSGFGQQKSFADILQDHPLGPLPVCGHSSRPASRNAFTDGVEPSVTTETDFALDCEIASLDRLGRGENVKSTASLQNAAVSATHSFASVLGSSIARSTTPNSQLAARTFSPRLPHVGARLDITVKDINNGLGSFAGASSNLTKSDDLLAALSCVSLSSSVTLDAGTITQAKLQQKIDVHQNFRADFQDGQNHRKQHSFLKKSEPSHLDILSSTQSVESPYLSSTKRGVVIDSRNSVSKLDGQVEMHMPDVQSAQIYRGGPPSPSIASWGGSVYSQSLDGVNAHCPQLQVANHIRPANLSPLFENATAASALTSFGIDSSALGGGLPLGSLMTGVGDMRNSENRKAAALQPLADPLYLQYLRQAGYAAQPGSSFAGPIMERGYAGSPYVDLLEMQKAYIGALFLSQEHYSLPLASKSGALTHSYYGSPAYRLGTTYPGKSSLSIPILPVSPVGPGSAVRHSDRGTHFDSGLRNFTGGMTGTWRSDSIGSMDNNYPSSLLVEFKSNKTRCFELSEIAEHVVGFSGDQYGSRFIQQKLETATDEEKNMVFEEIMPQALSLMTDVFGNYVVQKFFEHGSADQIRELADKLNGHVLVLSLQMYGCRVIQKALEVVDLDQKTRMVQELDGHVMRCVRDQNGNHVIQKCIECIPQSVIQFIISTFYEQIVTLSTHPYGCRVVQRILEHCDDPKTQEIVMDEILQCVCTLAQDQYGNYVIQHVLEHGNPYERSVIIKKLAGQIVKMSQQKFASNVIEKCLTFGGLGEREILVNEMLGSTDENEPLQAMMKDQFGNYVVQKVLETCDDQQRELILSRMKVHLNALKKYTYGKHIVAHVEKLITTGERRIGLQSVYSS